jgi:hypothetical protein
VFQKIGGFPGTISLFDKKENAQLGETIWMKVDETKKTTETDLTEIDERKCVAIT